MEKDGKNLSMGIVKSSQYKEEWDTLIVRYGGSNSICAANKSYSAEVHYQCDQDAGTDSRPTYLANFPCHAVFLWKTKAVCRVDVSADAHPAGSPSLHSGGSSSGRSSLGFWSKLIYIVLAIVICRVKFSSALS